jgi:phosphoglycolate phosphatase-like HAD superfamily hydrolase
VATAVSRLLLFDIDGTLLNAGGVGRRAFTTVLARAGADRRVLDGLRFVGTTDWAIARAALAASGLATDRASIQRIFDDYVAALDAELSSAASHECTLCPGVFPLLDRLTRAPVGVGLGTGNVEPGAWLKLRAVGIDRYFHFGGFGNEHEERAEVLRLAVARGAAASQVPEGTVPQVIVIGDTPRDVLAAQAIGAQSLAVATGQFDSESLAAAGPTRVVPDLTHPAVLPFLAGGG